MSGDALLWIRTPLWRYVCTVLFVYVPCSTKSSFWLLDCGTFTVECGGGLEC